MKKMMLMAAALGLSLTLFAGMASAHVKVYPAETTQGAYEVFTVRVPTEKDIPTTKVEVKIPDGVDVSRFEPMPGWKYDLAKDATGKIVSVTWTATGGGLSSTEFGDFHMQGKVGSTATSLSWKAIQTYQDGSVVEWVGADGSDHPASVMTVSAKAGGSGAGGSGGAALYLSIAALALGVLSLIVALMRRRKG